MKVVTKIIIILLLLTLISALGCIDNARTNIGDTNQENDVIPNDANEARLNESDTIRIGAFNIQVFGSSKASESETMNIIAKIIHDYDIIVIQEIRDKSETALPRLIELVDKGKHNYDFVMSDSNS